MPLLPVSHHKCSPVLNDMDSWYGPLFGSVCEAVYYMIDRLKHPKCRNRKHHPFLENLGVGFMVYRAIGFNILHAEHACGFGSCILQALAGDFWGSIGQQPMDHRQTHPGWGFGFGRN